MDQSEFREAGLDLRDLVGLFVQKYASATVRELAVPGRDTLLGKLQDMHSSAVHRARSVIEFRHPGVLCAAGLDDPAVNDDWVGDVRRYHDALVQGRGGTLTRREVLLAHQFQHWCGWGMVSSGDLLKAEESAIEEAARTVQIKDRVLPRTTGGLAYEALAGDPLRNLYVGTDRLELHPHRLLDLAEKRLRPLGGPAAVDLESVPEPEASTPAFDEGQEVVELLLAWRDRRLDADLSRSERVVCEELEQNVFEGESWSQIARRRGLSKQSVNAAAAKFWEDARRFLRESA